MTKLFQFQIRGRMMEFIPYHNYMILLNPEIQKVDLFQFYLTKKTTAIVNNESSEILRILNSAFDPIIGASDRCIDLYPKNLQGAIDSFCTEFNDNFVVATYRAGHAKTIAEYQHNYNMVFLYLSKLNETIMASRTIYILSDDITLADVHAFCHLIRFDEIFYIAFCLNAAHLWEYEGVRSYLTKLCSIDAFRETIDMAEMKKGAFLSQNNWAENMGCKKIPLGSYGSKYGL